MAVVTSCLRGSALSALLLGCCAGCATTGGNEAGTAPDMAMPAAFEQVAREPTGTVPAVGWPATFGSAELAALVASADRENLDRAAADARWQQAVAHAKAARAALHPSLSSAATVASSAGRASGESAQETDWSALLLASWEWDLWGRNRATWQSAWLQAQASGIEREAVRAATAVAVVSAYFQVLSLRERAVLARSALQAAQRVLGVVEVRFAAGAVGPAELAAQRAAVASAELAIAPLMQAEVEARTALALLLGRVPEGFLVAGDSLADVTVPPLVAGVPSDLLHRRPDIAAAELMLEAARADVRAARAALFPTVTLTVAGGLQNPAMQAAVTTLSGTGVGLNLGAALLQTVFDGGRRESVRDEARAHEQALLLAYRQTIFVALRDVEASLSSVQLLEGQQAAQQRAVDASAQAFAAAEARYREGAGDSLALLGTQRALCAAQDQQMQHHLAHLLAQVSVFRALGGGWEHATASTTVRGAAQ